MAALDGAREKVGADQRKQEDVIARLRAGITKLAALHGSAKP